VERSPGDRQAAAPFLCWEPRVLLFVCRCCPRDCRRRLLSMRLSLRALAFPDGLPAADSGDAFSSEASAAVLAVFEEAARASPRVARQLARIGRLVARAAAVAQPWVTAGSMLEELNVPAVLRDAIAAALGGAAADRPAPETEEAARAGADGGGEATSETGESGCEARGGEAQEPMEEGRAGEGGAAAGPGGVGAPFERFGVLEEPPAGHRFLEAASQPTNLRSVCDACPLGRPFVGFLCAGPHAWLEGNRAKVLLCP
jgi:hypothetical protein